MMKKRLLFLDIETNSNSASFNKEDQEIIEVGIYDPFNKKEFNQFVNINKPLSENIKRLTWITDEEIKSWKNINEVLDNAIKFIWNKDDIILVWHNLEDFDLYILSKNNPKFLEYNYIDSLHIFLLLFPWLKSYTVQNIYKTFIDQNYEEKHQALDDSKDEYKLFNELINKDFLDTYYQKNGKNIAYVKDILNKYDDFGNKKCLNIKYIKNLLQDIDVEYTWQKWMLLKKYFRDFKPQIKQRKAYFEQKMLTDDKINAAYENFIKKTWNSIRAQQKSMIQHIKDIFNEWENLFIEAWTWTWKTFGYLIPAIEHLKKNKSDKVFISTYTKVLQWQLMEKDIPLIEKNYPEIKTEQLKADSEAISLQNIPFKGSLSFWNLTLWNRLYRENFYISDIHYSIISKLWNDTIESYRYNVIINKDNYDLNYWFEWKFYFQINKWNLFIINHAFMISKFNQFYINPINWLPWFRKYPKIDPSNAYFVIDEWHNLENVIREMLTLDYTKLAIKKILSLFSHNNPNNIISKIKSFIHIKNRSIENLIDDSEKSNELRVKYIEDISTFENLIKLITEKMNSEEFTQLILLFKKYVDNFSKSQLYINALNDVEVLRQKWYDTNIAEYTKEDFDSWYTFSDLKAFLEYWLDFFNKLEKDAKNIYNELNYEDDAESTGKLFSSFTTYFFVWENLLKNKSDDYFFNTIIEFKEAQKDLVNFWFTAIPIRLFEWSNFLWKSKWNIILSATLFDKNENSYLLKEIFWNKYRYQKKKKYEPPFDYPKQRRILVTKGDNQDDNYKIMNKYIQSYGGRTLILTNTTAEKLRITTFCKNIYDKKWILTLMHSSGSMDSKTNQRNVEQLRKNPNTILVWSKSYAEWVDVPWDNLKLVVLTKLPYLPPRPFIKFKERERKDEWRNYVYNFLCSITFRQSIWRLIRTKTDTWDVLILDERLLNNTGQFFRSYIDGEKINIVS